MGVKISQSKEFKLKKGGQIYKINNITEVIQHPGLKITQEYSIDGLE